MLWFFTKFLLDFKFLLLLWIHINLTVTKFIQSWKTFWLFLLVDFTRNLFLHIFDFKSWLWFCLLRKVSIIIYFVRIKSNNFNVFWSFFKKLFPVFHHFLSLFFIFLTLFFFLFLYLFLFDFFFFLSLFWLQIILFFLFLNIFQHFIYFSLIFFHLFCRLRLRLCNRRLFSSCFLFCLMRNFLFLIAPFLLSWWSRRRLNWFWLFILRLQCL